MRLNNENLVRHQKSVFHPPDRADESEILNPLRNFYSRMFIEDTSLGIMPIGGRSGRTNFSVKLTTDSPAKVKGLVMQALAETVNPGREDLTRCVCEFARRCAAQICANDRSTYEIVYIEDEQTRELVGFEFAFIPEEQIVRKRGRTIQIFEAETEGGKIEKNKIVLDDAELLIVEAPVEYKRSLRQTRTGLQRLGESPLAEMALEANQKKLPYDFKIHERCMRTALADVVRTIGWNARGTFNDSVTSYFLVQRQIQYEVFKIKLRHAIFEALNLAIQHAIHKFGFRAELTITGLPTIQDTVDALDKLKAGATPFTEIMDVFRIGEHG